MPVQNIWFLLILSFSFPVVFCKYDYYHYISKYHKVVSTTESIPSLKPGISPVTIAASPLTSDSSPHTVKDIYSVSEDTDDSKDDISSEEDTFTKGNKITGTNETETILQRGNPYDEHLQSMFIFRVVMIVGSLALFVSVLGCIVCCCNKCRGTPRRGFIVGENRATEVLPQQPLVPHQPVAVQHFPPNYTQQSLQPFPPDYPRQPVQYFPQQYPQPAMQPQQCQYSPVHQQQAQVSPTTLQFYNPPEVPPPYEEKPGHKY